MRKIILFISFVFFLGSCKTNLVYITVMDPAPVTISNTVKQVGVVNRSIPSDDAKVLNMVHQVLSAESMAMIKEGGIESIRGLKDALMENKRFEKIISIDSLPLYSPGAGIFPAPLSWDKVEDICKKNKVDALFVLEVFDTELKIDPLTKPIDLSKPVDITKAMQVEVNMTTLVKTGWRIYDPQIRSVLDEYPLTQSMNFTASGINAAVAAKALIGRKEAVKQTANRAGHIYADRILPDKIRVSRDYYVKGNSNFKMATRKARSGNWDGAEEIWKKETQNPKNKLAGRACYNMAIINEINDDLDSAIKWAQKAYEEHNNRLALHYINLLKDRKSKNRLLEIQQKE